MYDHILILPREMSKTLNSSTDVFLKMKRLRLFKILCRTNCCDLTYLSNESLSSSFKSENLVILLLPYSNIEQLWKKNILKVLNLKGSENLIKASDFTTAPNLEILVLEGCTRLAYVHPSVGVLTRLKLLNLRGCKSLRIFPTKIGMESLEMLILSSCSKLQGFLKIDGKMECLLELWFDGTNIKELPSSIGNLSSLVLLNLKDCRSLVDLHWSIVEYLPENLEQIEFLEELDSSETSVTKPPPFIFQFKNLKVMSFNGIKRPSSKLKKKILSSLLNVIQTGRTISMALTLPSLLGLSSLTRLNLRDCNLCEGDIPGDISRLSSLKQLDLGGNNFISIPSCVTRFSKLEFLRLLDCRALKSLPELPTSIRGLRINGCTSLEIVANPDWATILGVNCFRLAENIDALTLLKKYLKVFGNSRKKFVIIIPGSELQQRGGSSIKIDLPLEVWNDSQWMGVALCCIFVSDNASRDENLMCRTVIHGRYSRQANFDWSGCSLNYGLEQPVTKDHMLIRYFSRDKFYPISLEDKCGERETNNLWTTDCLDQECHQLDLSFTDPFHNSVKVKKCGVRILHSSQCCANFEDIQQHSVDDGSIGNGPQSKQMQKKKKINSTMSTLRKKH
ncbi:hypothetical protein GOBAR_AA29347 [Gossypium barbadense]|uniref:Disease resistance protein RPS4B/Roq1-like leucine-rich repeats domain-containing protein n=1 Tax=Gossypium barbadense TaxID=3634 RepID=A0A2P5WJS7_GOSBA|nr:hypothetical protein GOBAR_AA29347 [Gossypium barbadense]